MNERRFYITPLLTFFCW